MHFKYLLLAAALGVVASAQSLMEALASQNTSLSALNGLLATQPDLLSSLGNATNITILAPSNEALTTFLNSTAGMNTANISGAVTALLQYHVLNGTYHNFTTRPEFIPTMLSNATLANVTGGQRVEATRNGTNVTFLSGLVERSLVSQANINFTGGTIHIIDHVLTIPDSVSSTAVAANLTSLIGALTQLNSVNSVNALRDVTIFAPSNAAFQNIGSALSNLTTEQLTGIVEYHVVNGTVGYSSSLSNETLTTLGGKQITCPQPKQHKRNPRTNRKRHLSRLLRRQLRLFSTVYFWYFGNDDDYRRPDWCGRRSYDVD
ncbi:hypothetical protein G7Y89_g8700 [Cudoniella acicularis]|uniref:FAS1 domain-containing protein n=1 Tax=Cudoniella acicularis TaxID=354080 RepID=A0A8H4W3B3_9HELO|nr:hypothetical protein G7Y89_g8700 [Cudoniella acicularis]